MVRSHLVVLLLAAISAVFASAAVQQSVRGATNHLVKRKMQHKMVAPPDLNDKMPLKAQEQGFKGKDVEHKDGETFTDDFRKEYGPSDSASAKKPTTKSGSIRAGAMWVLTVAVSAITLHCA
mmetsp:Transcript_120003/g.208398  ORF Transcript_120003/g.208398 Transcript_120003/m.208398 type:complete len:122 (-) Transcript_120003:221-586(-)